MQRKKRTSSDGTIGEQMFLYLANRIGWSMTRIQPPTRYVNTATGFRIVPIGVSDDPKPPDYVGYRIIGCSGEVFHEIVWCEVKEAHGDTMPASRLSKQQRLFMGEKPLGTCFVCVVWMGKTGIIPEIFSFKSEGSYKNGEGFATSV